MRPLVLAISALLAVAATASAADPAPDPAVRDHPARAVAFAGPRLMWLDVDGKLHAQDPGGPARVAFVPERQGAEFVEVALLAASAQRVAFTTDGLALGGEGGPETAWTSVRAGGVDGPWPVVAGHEGGRAFPPEIEQLSVYDGGLLYVGIVDGKRQVTVQPDGQPARALVRGPDSLRVTATGGFAAVAAAPGRRAGEPTNVTIYELASLTPLVSLRVSGEPGIAIGDDGTLLVLRDGVLLWASPAAPDFHEIATSVRQIGGIASGTVLFTAASGGFERIRAADLATDAQRDVTPAFVTGDTVGLLTVWDGTHFAYDDGFCLFAGDLPAAPAANLPTAPGCPRPPLGTSARVARGHRAVTAVARCPGGTADRCDGTVRLEGRVGGRLRTVATKSFALSGGKSASLTLAPKRALLRRVGSRADRRRHRHRVLVRFRASADGVDRSTYGVVLRG